MTVMVKQPKWMLLAFFLGLLPFCPIKVQAGVSGLTRFLRAKKSTWWSAKEKRPFEAEHVCIDMNQLLHGAFRSSSDPSHCMAKIFVGLDNLLKLVIPTKTLVLTFDGPAPFAKLQTQRNRRLSTPENCLITPGTDFMNAMENVMICYVLQRAQRPAFHDLTVFISGAGEPGEGELKIVDWINTHMPSPNDSLVICGSDSDILLQGITLMQGDARNISVLQSNSDYPDAFCNVSALVNELAAMTSLVPHSKNSVTTQPTTGKGGVGGTVSSTAEKGLKFKNAPLPTTDRDDDEIAKDLWENTGHLPPVFTSVPKSMHLDIVVLFIMQGNDYLPKLRGMAMTKALRVYGKVMRQLPPNERYLIDLNRGSFNFVALWHLMREIRGDGYVQLPEQYPTCLQSLHTVLQRRKLTELIWNDTQVSPASAEESRSLERKTMWVSKTTVFGKDYTSGKCVSKQSARNEAARQILIDIDPEEYEYMLALQEKVRRKLKAFREAVIKEATEMGELRADMAGLAEAESNTNTNGDSKSGGGDGANLSVEGSIGNLDEVVVGSEDVDNKSIDVDDDDDDEELIPRREGIEPQGIDFTREVHPEEADFIDSGGDDDEESIEAEGDGEERSCVTEAEYMKYVRDADIEDYLKGILWVIQMYVDGVCPDYSYTFAGRPPPTANIIMYYIEKNILRCADGVNIPTAEGGATEAVDNSTVGGLADAATTDDYPLNSTYKWLLSSGYTSEETGARTIDALRQGRAGRQPYRWALQELRSKVSVPRSQLKPLSPGATAVCVIPQVGGAVIPKHLRGIWRRMQQSFFRGLPGEALTSTDYMTLTGYLKEIWQSKEEDEAKAKTQTQAQEQTSTTASSATALQSAETSPSSNADNTHAVNANGDGDSSPVLNESGDWIVPGRRNQRRASRRARKEKAIVKHREKMATIKVHPMNLISEDLDPDADTDADGDEDQDEDEFGYDGELGEDDFDDDTVFFEDEYDVEDNYNGDLYADEHPMDDPQETRASNPEAKGEKSDKFPTVSSTSSKPLGPIFVRDGDSEWIVISRLSGDKLHRPAYLPPFRTYNLRLPLPLPFHTPRRLPEGVRVMRAPQTVLCPLRKFIPASLRGRSSAVKGAIRQQEKQERRDRAASSDSQELHSNGGGGSSSSSRRSDRRTQSGSNSNSGSRRQGNKDHHKEKGSDGRKVVRDDGSSSVKSKGLRTGSSSGDRKSSGGKSTSTRSSGSGPRVNSANQPGSGNGSGGGGVGFRRPAAAATEARRSKSNSGGGGSGGKAEKVSSKAAGRDESTSENNSNSNSNSSSNKKRKEDSAQGAPEDSSEPRLIDGAVRTSPAAKSAVSSPKSRPSDAKSSDARASKDSLAAEAEGPGSGLGQAEQSAPSTSLRRSSGG